MLVNINTKTGYFLFRTTLQKGIKSEQRKLLEVLYLQGLRHASRVRMREGKMCIGRYVRVLCVCVCVSKLFGLTEDKVQKDAKNRIILCSTSFT